MYFENFFNDFFSLNVDTMRYKLSRFSLFFFGYVEKLNENLNIFFL